jgi:hypothetical protein
MDLDKINIYQFQLTNSVVMVNLPRKFNNITKIKLLSLRGNTGLSNLKNLYICITDLNNKFSISHNINYFKCIAVPSTNNTTFTYENFEQNFYDVILEKPIHLNTLNIELLYDGQYSSSINNNNSIFIELSFI